LLKRIDFLTHFIIQIPLDIIDKPISIHLVNNLSANPLNSILKAPVQIDASLKPIPIKHPKLQIFGNIKWFFIGTDNKLAY
jgi:hypothetical protein